MTLTLRDCFNTSAAQAVLYSKRLNSDEESKLRAFLKRSGGRGYVPVTYEEDGIGRFKSYVPDAKGARGPWVPHFMTGLPSKVRHALTCELDHDLDMKCCHPTLMAQILKGLSLPSKYVEYYVAHCNEVRNEVAEVCGVTPAVAKMLFNRIVYGGSISAWAKDNGVSATVPDFATDLYNEIQENRPKVLEVYPECVEHQKKAKPEHWNPEASALSFVLAEAEKKCLKAMMEFSNNEKIEVHSLMHDGITVGRRLVNGEPVKGPMEKAVLSRMAAYVFAKTGFVVVIEEKPMSAALLEGVDPIVITSDDDASDKFMESYAGEVMKDNGRVFVLRDGLWRSGAGVEEIMVQMCLAIDLVKEGANGLKPYSKDVPSAKRIVTAVRAKLPNTPGFVRSLFESNLGYILFKDGVYNFGSACFIPFSAEPGLRDRVRSTIRIERDFPIRNEANIAEFYKTVIDPIFPDEDRKKYFLGSCARGMAGHFTDKEWLVCVGDRNAGKGVMVGAFEAAFEGYVGTFNADAFMYRTNIGDSAKDRSWMLDHEFHRLIFSNECTNDPSRKLKLNGNLIKSFNSGGDNLVARKNFQDEVTFRVQARMAIMVNDLPPVRPADAMETMAQVAFETVFKEGLESGAMSHMRAANPGIKAFIQRPEMRDAFVHIVLDHYSATRPKRPECVVQDTEVFVEADGFRSTFAEHFEVTGLESDVIPCYAVACALADLGMSPNKLGRELTKLGVRSKNVKNVKSYVGVKAANGF